MIAVLSSSISSFHSELGGADAFASVGGAGAARGIAGFGRFDVPTG